MTVSDTCGPPTISVVIPSYNYAATLARAAQSVLLQLDSASELLIIDDGSVDDTPAVIDALMLDYPGQFRAIRKKNGGAASARNLGIQESLGTWLIFLDADDQMEARALKQLQAHIVANPESRMVIGGHTAIFEDGHRRQHPADVIPNVPIDRVKAYLIDKRLAVSNGACAMHREVFFAGNYPEHFRISEDIPVFSQVFACYPISRLDAVLALIYKHDDSLRHHLGYGQSVGTLLVDEVFSRLPADMQKLKKDFYIQRCLSLFRSAYRAGHRGAALFFFKEAYRNDWRVILKFSYSRKLMSMMLSGKRE